jgi:hypothetical protein
LKSRSVCFRNQDGQGSTVGWQGGPGGSARLRRSLCAAELGVFILFLEKADALNPSSWGLG